MGVKCASIWWSVVWHSCLPEGILYVGATSLVCMMEFCLHSPYMCETCLSDTHATWVTANPPEPSRSQLQQGTHMCCHFFLWFCDGLAWISLCVWNSATRGCSHSHVMISHALVTLCCILSFFCALCFRIAVFSVPVLHDDRIVLVAEQRPDASEEDSFQWMSRVLQVLCPFLFPGE